MGSEVHGLSATSLSGQSRLVVKTWVIKPHHTLENDSLIICLKAQMSISCLSSDHDLVFAHATDRQLKCTEMILAEDCLPAH